MYKIMISNIILNININNVIIFIEDYYIRKFKKTMIYMFSKQKYIESSRKYRKKDNFLYKIKLKI